MGGSRKHKEKMEQGSDTSKGHKEMLDVVKDIIGRALGTVINPTLEYVDVDGIAQRIQVDELIQRIDVNAVIDKVDVDRLLERIDINKQLDRIDIDTLLSRIDINEIIRRSDMGAVITRSTTGLFTPLLDAARTEFVFADLFLFRMARFRMRDHKGLLPPRPGVGATGREREYFPKGRMNKAIAVQGRYTGFFSKAGAIFLDMLFVTLSFALLSVIIKICWILFLDVSQEEAKQKVKKENLAVAVLYCIFWFLYFFLAVLPTGQTLGMVIAGIKLRRTDGSDISASQAAVRTLLLPLSLTVMPFLGLVGYFRRDGRMLHDIIAGTGLVYSWDSSMAKARRSAQVRAEQIEMDYKFSSYEGSDDTEDDSSSRLLDEDRDTGGGGSYSTLEYSTGTTGEDSKKSC